MSINPTTIEIDKRLFGNFSPEDLQNKRDQLGFYKKSETSYVLSTRIISERPNFNSNISDLASVLNQSVYDPESLKSLSPESSYMVTRYMNCVYKVINKHNTKIARALQNPFLYALSCIPLIGRIVYLFYSIIQEPDRFVDSFKQVQKIKVENYFKEAGTLATLKRNKEDIDRAFSLASKETDTMHGNGFDASMWSDYRRIITKGFESALETRYTGLSKARIIVSDPTQAPDIGTSADSYTTVAQKVSKLIQELDISDELAKMATEGQLELRLQAIARIKYLEANWVQHHLNNIYTQAEQRRERPSIEQLLGVKDITEMVGRFLEYHRALTILNPLGNATRDKLEISFNRFIQPLFDQLISDAVSVQYAKSPKEVKTQLEKYFKQLEAYKLYRTPFRDNDIKKEEIERKEENLLMIRDRALCRLVPLYGEARSIMKMSNYNGIPSIEQSDSKNFSEIWYEEKLKYFEYELTRIDSQDFSKETFIIILNAQRHLQTQLAKCKKETMEKVVREQSQTKGLFNSIGTFFWGKDGGKEQPTKMYKESLLKLLNMKESEDFSKSYAKKLRELQKLPDHETLKGIIQTAFKGYNRAMEIQPFITKVASGLWGSHITIEELNPKNKPLEVFREETMALARLFEEEIVIQMQNGYHNLVANLKKAKEQIENLLTETICAKYPVYKKFIELQKQYTDKNTFSSKLVGVEVHKQYTAVIEDIEKETAEVPAFVSAAAVQAKLKVTYSYKEWEADRILKVVEDHKNRYGALDDGDAQQLKLAIYGLDQSAKTKDVRVRERALYLLLHPDRNGELPSKLKEKVIEASKVLGSIR